MKYYYKVVAREGDKLVSAVCNKRELKDRGCGRHNRNQLLKLKLIYKINEWTISNDKKYGITIFESPERAKLFRSGVSTYLIYKCRGIGIRKPNVPIKILGSSFTDDDYGWPVGTLMADKIKLIKEIS